MASPISVRRLDPAEIALLGEIDRAEHVETLYSVERGSLTATAVDIDVPPWDPERTGDHSVKGMIETWRPRLERGAALLGAFDAGEFAGLALVEASFEPGMAWLALLHVTRSHRRRGVASTLWNEAVRLGRAAGATSMYVSATPTGSAVGFYLRQGCELAGSPHPDLLAKEPEDIHLICPLD